MDLSYELTKMTLQPVGFVRSEVKEPPGSGYPWDTVISQVVVDTLLTEALDGLEDFSHLIVLYWMHLVDKSKLTLKTHPRGKPELPLTGLFATRTPFRPNPIGKATVRLLERKGNVLTVQGLDAVDGTPVIDVKPFIPGSDAPKDVRVPPWVTRH